MIGLTGDTRGMRISDRSRSPYMIGAGIGALNVLAFLTAKRGLGVTSAFESSAALIERQVAPKMVNRYIKAREEVPRTDWESFLALGIPIGSYLMSRSARDSSSGTISPTWSRRFGPSKPRRFVGAFFGGALMMFGARLAKGCTSGHALTGTSQLALSSWVFTPLMFATAVLSAHMLFPEEK